MAIASLIEYDSIAKEYTNVTKEYDEKARTTLVYKHPEEDFNSLTQLVVHESQEAIFFMNGQALDLFGPGRYTLETENIPGIGNALKHATGGLKSPFRCEVYFINMATQMGIKWGTDTKVRLFDPASGLHIELGASGDFNIHVTDSRKLLLKIVGTTHGLKQSELLSTDGCALFRGMVMTQVKSYLAQIIKEKNINVMEIDAQLLTLSEGLREKINVYLAEYGLTMPEFFVSRVVTPDDDPNYRRMKEQYAAQYLNVREEEIRKRTAEAEAQRKFVEAETAARLKAISAQGEADALRIQKQAEADAYRMKAEAEALEMKMKGYTYQQETARQIGMEAMQNGIPSGGGVSGTVGDLAGLGIGLGALGGVVGMAKEVVTPMMDMGKEMGAGIAGTAVPGKCAKCGAVLPVGAKFCMECGEKVAPVVPDGMTTCPNCGKLVTKSNFCPECGSKL